uniref:Uncharacterized protein n=1 Tax=Fusarium oxysporum (strain Fo5176) TaxID=660025 RepID=A0A0D2XHF6_FUSOF
MTAGSRLVISENSMLRVTFESLTASRISSRCRAVNTSPLRNSSLCTVVSSRWPTLWSTPIPSTHALLPLSCRTRKSCTRRPRSWVLMSTTSIPSTPTPRWSALFLRISKVLRNVLV